MPNIPPIGEASPLAGFSPSNEESRVYYFSSHTNARTKW